MKLFIALLVTSFAELTSASVLTFENLNPAPASYDVMPSPYSGFTFSGWFYGPDTIYTPASGVIDLFTDYYNGDPTVYIVTNLNSISRGTSFFFDGAFFSGYSGVAFELYLGGSLVGTSSILPDAGAGPYGPTWLSSGYAGLVDTVRVAGVQGYYSMDNFTYRDSGSSGGGTGGGTIPEPSTYGLVILSLGLAGFLKRKAP